MITLEVIRRLGSSPEILIVRSLSLVASNQAAQAIWSALDAATVIWG